MSETAELQAEIERLKQEVTELQGLSLATGVILTQLLQTSCLREMKPYQAATKIVENARAGIEAFAEQNGPDPKMKERALQGVQQYEDQIRSVLPV